MNALLKISEVLHIKHFYILQIKSNLHFKYEHLMQPNINDTQIILEMQIKNCTFNDWSLKPHITKQENMLSVNNHRKMVIHLKFTC